MSSRLLIVSFIAFFALASLLLFWQNERDASYTDDKNWWAVAFTEPGDTESLNFRIENYSFDRNFTYRVLVAGAVVEEDGIRLLSGESADLTVANRATAPSVVEITSENEIKSLTRK